MRVAILFVAVAACTPDIVPGSYLCGPNKACPEDQVCSDSDNTCVLPGLAQPFACLADVDSEPDDTRDAAYTLQNLDCQTLPIVIHGCLPVGDGADWYKLTPPASCAGTQLDARITFPVAFQRVGLELVDMTSGSSLATDGPCKFEGEGGDDLRCLAATLTPGTTYLIGVVPTGEGNCDGDCAFNRYTLRVQLGTAD